MIEKVVRTLSTDSRMRLFIIFNVGFVIVTYLFALELSPWFYSINTRVRLFLEAPAVTKILLCWDKSETQCLPLVPYSSTNNRVAEAGEVANVWMTELPPRSSYSITVIFKSSVKNVVLHHLELDSSRPFLIRVPGAGVGSVDFAVNQFKRYGISQTVTGGLYYLESTARGQLALNQEIIPGTLGISRSGTTIIVWALLFSIYLLVAIPIYLFPHVMSNLGSAVQAAEAPKYPRWVHIVFGGAILAMLLIAVNSGVIFNEHDPMNYLFLALSGKWLNEVRLPGYPLFLGSTLWVFRYNLDGVIFLQASIFASSVIISIWTLRKWIPHFAALVFVFLSLFSPAQIYWSRWILRESLFSSLLLLGTIAAISHFTSPKELSKIWLYIFVVICGYAFLVRENGIILPVALLPVLVTQIIKHLFSSKSIAERAQSVFRLVLYYSGPVVVIGIIIVVFSTYNYLHYGYFQIGIHQTSHAYLAKAIYPGNSDARSLLDPGPSVGDEAKSYLGWPLYSSYIVARDQTPGLDPVYMALYPSVLRQMHERGEFLNTFHLASILNDIGNNMYSLVPGRANLSGLLRLYSEVISLNRIGSYPLQATDPYATVSLQGLLDRLPKKIVLTESSIEAKSILADYYRVTQRYRWFGILLLLALFSSIYILRHEDAVFLAPITIFIANSVLLIITRLVSQRYLANLDILLILQTAMGLGLWMNKNIYVKRIPTREYVREGISKYDKA
jgi:hypothetical protein